MVRQQPEFAYVYLHGLFQASSSSSTITYGLAEFVRAVKPCFVLA